MVGWAMAAAPAEIPWQRVVNASGRVSPRADRLSLVLHSGITVPYLAPLAAPGGVAPPPSIAVGYASSSRLARNHHRHDLRHRSSGTEHLARQKALLRREGVRFDRSGRIDLVEFGWLP
jgi:alkylated DNA nucleotide flippase Atl1